MEKFREKIIIGITGGIGSGKSTVTKYLLEKGYTVLDCDQLSRNLTTYDRDVLDEISSSFGREYIQNGILDRKKLADLVFKNPSKKKILENIVTNKVINISKIMVDNYKNEKYDQLAKSFEKYKLLTLGTKELLEKVFFIDAPLLFQCSMDSLCNCIWLVKADLDQRVERTMKRDGMTREEVVRRISSQLSQEEMEEGATFVVDNSKSKEMLKEEVDRLIEESIFL